MIYVYLYISQNKIMEKLINRLLLRLDYFYYYFNKDDLITLKIY